MEIILTIQLKQFFYCCEFIFSGTEHGVWPDNVELYEPCKGNIS